MKDIGYAVTVVLPSRYFTAELYVAVPGDRKNPDEWAKVIAAALLRQLADYVPEAQLQVTAVRRIDA